MIKRRFCATLIAGIMALGLLAGCGDTDSSAAPASASASSSKTETSVSSSESTVTENKEITTITVWNNAAHEVSVREKQIEAFNNGEGKELGIFIDYQTYGDKYEDTIKIAAQAGEAPEIFTYNSKFGLDFVDAGYIVPLEDLPGSEGLINNFKPYLTNQGQIFNGKTYTLPYSLTTYGFVINKDLFKQAGLTEADYPKTWEDVRKVAKIITDASNGKAYGLGISSTLWTVTSFYTFGNGMNVGHYGYDWTNKRFDYSAFNPLIKAIDEMANDGTLFPGFENLDGDGIRAQFSAGNIAMIGAASFDCSVYVNQFPATCDWEVIDIPAFSENGTRYKPFGNSVNLLCVGTAALESEDKAAKVEKVLEFFYDDKNAGEMYENGIYIPVRPEAVAAATKEPELKGWASFANFDEIFAMPPVPDTLISVEGKAYREVIVNMWTNPELDDVEALMADVDKRYNDALKLADQDKVNLYVLPAGVTPERGK
ncbi:MAG: extracellular solute-binding protein [Lachnospiraceae bacterium]|nr:extracellular solute-binding protein [Lachnospiraceae bacterium]